MSSVTEVGMDGASGDVQRTEQRAVGERGVRWSARRKEGVVMRLLRGESLDLLARETGQPAGRIASWREEFLGAGREGLKARPLGSEDRALADAQRKVGELSMEVDVLKALLDKKGPLSRRGARSERAAARTPAGGVPGGWRVALGGV